jgi:hypothetical protein
VWAGTGEAFDRCEETGCAPGLVCLGDARQRYACIELCDEEHPCSRGDCAWVLPDRNGDEIAGTCAILDCDPFDGRGGCPAGYSCALIPGGTVCLLPGPTPPGGPCVWSEDCAAGTSCIYPRPGAPSGKCLWHCDPEGEPCPYEMWCYPIEDGVGICDV